jgi:DNA repair protein RecN (Recombination protein N)
MTYDLKEFAGEILNSINDIESDTENLSTIESRLDIIYKLKRKYGETLDDILQFYNSSKQQLETILLSDQKIEVLKNSIESQFECVSGLAEEISKSRHDCSKNFADEVSKRLELLDLPSVKFQIHIKSTELTSSGKDYLEFFISTNKGQELRPLTKVASGGELSRIMLAIKNVLSEQDFIDTLIFDEIDTGVSGSTAHNIGVQLKKTADKKQIICVTHSAQIAALADSHFFISKATKDDKTFTSVKLLDLESRKLEIARILGGSLITDSILQSAEEMITNSSYL